MSVPWTVKDGRTTTSKSHAFDAWAPLQKLSEAASSWLLDTVMTDESACVCKGVLERKTTAKAEMKQAFSGMGIVLLFNWKFQM